MSNQKPNNDIPEFLENLFNLNDDPALRQLNRAMSLLRNTRELYGFDKPPDDREEDEDDQ